MRTQNNAHWTRTKEGWLLIVTLLRHWETPGIGKGKGETYTAMVSKKGEHAQEKTVKLVSNIFKDRNSSDLKAYAVLVDGNT